MDQLEISARYQRGDSIKRIVRESGTQPHRLYSILPKTTRRVCRISDEAISEICNSYAESVRCLARRLGVSKSSVHRIRQRHYRDEDERETAAELDRSKRSRTRQNEDVGFLEAVKPWRCSKHGLVNTFPCVACVALNSRATNGNPTFRD